MHIKGSHITIRFFLSSAFYAALAFCCTSHAFNTKLTLGLGYENVTHLQQNQGKSTLFVRMGLSKDLILTDWGRFSFEIAARTGYHGLLDLPEALQDQVGGPYVVAHSGPSAEFFIVATAPMSDSKVYMVYKLGLDISVLNFERCDVPATPAINVAGQIGVGKYLNATSDITVTIGSSYPTTTIELDNSLGINFRTPYPSLSIIVSWLASI